MDLCIGDIRLDGNLLLAPIAGYTDLPFRLVARECGGVSLAFTDLISPEGLLRGTRPSLLLSRTCAADSPLGLQLYGCDAEVMTRAARRARDHGIPLIDINMGCPAHKIVRREGGAALLRQPAAAVRLVERVARAVDVPVTVKLRLGWDSDHIVAPSMVADLERAGAAAITIHGRTAAQRFSGSVDLDGIARVVAGARHVPVIGNGDVRSPADAARMLAHTGCAGVMMGRAALADPWLLRDTRAYLAGEPPPPSPTREQRIDLAERHFRLLLEHLGERRACLSFRRRISWHARRLRPARRLQLALQKLDYAEQFYGALEAFREGDDAVAIPDESVCEPALGE